MRRSTASLKTAADNTTTIRLDRSPASRALRAQKCSVVRSSTTPTASTSNAATAPIRVSIRYELTEFER
jgi:hypothetical protein